MAETWVVNASPLIALDRIDRLSLVFDLGAEVVIPRGVLEEVAHGPGSIDPARLGRHRTVDVETLDPIVAAWDLGRGESQVLVWAASSPGSHAILDDRAARHCAIALSIPTFGTLRLLLRARAAGLVPSVTELVGALREVGFYLSDALVSNIRRAADE